MTTKFNPDDTGFVPVRIRSISILGDGIIKYSVDVIGISKQVNFSIKEEDLIKTPEDLKNYIIKSEDLDTEEPCDFKEKE